MSSKVKEITYVALKVKSHENSIQPHPQRLKLYFSQLNIENRDYIQVLSILSPSNAFAVGCMHRLNPVPASWRTNRQTGNNPTAYTVDRLKGMSSMARACDDNFPKKRKPRYKYTVTCFQRSRICLATI